MYENNYIQVYFNYGNLIEENVIWIGNNGKSLIGTLKNHTYLTNFREINVESTEDFKCLKVIRTSNNVPFKNSHKGIVKLPLKIIGLPEEQRILVRPSKIMFFIRVTKTGTVGMINLLHQLGMRLDYNVELNFGETISAETLFDDERGVQNKVNYFMKTHRNLVQCQHYSFIDFEKFNHLWRPDWFSIVRHPIEKVCTVFQLCIV